MAGHGRVKGCQSRTRASRRTDGSGSRTETVDEQTAARSNGSASLVKALSEDRWLSS